MPYRIDFKANVIQIIGGHFYTAIDTLCDTDYKWVPLEPETNGYFNQLCHIYFFSTIALTFGNLIPKVGTNTQFH